MDRMKGGLKFLTFSVFLAIAVAAGFYACGSSTDSVSTTATGDSGQAGGAEESIYPMFVDSNMNGANDYFEAATHDAGSSARVFGAAIAGHVFTDGDGDGICDYAQNGSNTWHGPGYVDENANGICDYWEEGTARHNMGGGMMWLDQNRDRINDYFEYSWHYSSNHSYIDLDGDGICDFAQDGTAGMWHGPGYVDTDSDGVCDYWEEGGKGHGGQHGHGHM